MRVTLQEGYSSKEGSYFSADRAEMLDFVPRSAKAILEVGCGAGQFAAALKADRACHVTGIEPFPKAAAAARRVVDRLIEADVEMAIQSLGGQAFDCIVFNDVLEHLIDPWTVLREVGNLLAPQGILVASIPNMRYAPVLAGLVLKGEWEYRSEGVLDRTHLRFFTFRSAANMLAGCGYATSRLEGINRGKSWKFALLRALTVGAASDVHFQQIAVVAKRADPSTPRP